MTKVLNPVIWLWIFAILNLVMGSGPALLDGQSVAEMGWGEGNTGEHDAMYETLLGISLALFSILTAGIALFTSGAARAKMTALVGVSMIGLMVVWLIYANAEDYDFGGPMIIIPIAMFSMLTLSGLANLKSAE